MSDLIRREDVIKILSQRSEILQGKYGDLGGACSGVLKIIKEIPSAEPVERTAKVISDDVITTVNGHRYHYEEYLCNVCKKKVFSCDFYCSYCGAKLDWSWVEPEQKWIPVSERLPKKESKSYWICTDTKYQCECRWTNNIYGIGKSNNWGWSIFDIPQYTRVIAWMPLPEPYRSE